MAQSALATQFHSRADRTSGMSEYTASERLGEQRWLPSEASGLQMGQVAHEQGTFKPSWVTQKTSSSERGMSEATRMPRLVAHTRSCQQTKLERPSR